MSGSQVVGAVVEESCSIRPSSIAVVYVVYSAGAHYTSFWLGKTHSAEGGCAAAAEAVEAVCEAFLYMFLTAFFASKIYKNCIVLPKRPKRLFKIHFLP